MQRRCECSSITWHLPDGSAVNFEYVHSSQVRNRDGSFAGDGQSDRLVLQKKVTIDGITRYTNCW